MVIVLIFSSLYGCASITPERCGTDSWFVAGEDDSMSVVIYEKAKEALDICVSKGFDVDQVQYKKGYEEGLAKYCKVQNASWMGWSGKFFN